MRLVLDMVHHNPSEKPFESRFLDPQHLANYGFNGKIGRLINLTATFAATGLDLFPAGSPERDWIDRLTREVEVDIATTKQHGLKVYYHVDLFILPRRLVEHFGEQLCNPDTGRIDLRRPKTLEMQRLLLIELCERFPEVDGFFIRVGETYLFDAPYHVGNGPIPVLGPEWTPTYLYDHLLNGEPAPVAWTTVQEDAYVDLITFLRDILCDQLGRHLIFRTWDIFPDKLHARLDRYLAITDRVEPHPLLAFSIKHTALDFWRRVKVNECLTRGRHPQIVEVQCQREYEGKGAYPNYVMPGVIDGFEENDQPLGLRDLLASPLLIGVMSWSRGGGWFGPYVPDELWPDLNAYVLGKFSANPASAEETLFREYATVRLGLTGEDVARFRELALRASRGILWGRYCAAFDHVLAESTLPSACWMRDDRLGGRDQLRFVFEYLHDHDLLAVALDEKREAVVQWERIVALADTIAWPDSSAGRFAPQSARYGLALFRIVYHGWRVMSAGFCGERSGTYDGAEIRDAAASYAAAWEAFRAVVAGGNAASPYVGCYFSLPGMPSVDGLDATVAHYLAMAER